MKVVSNNNAKIIITIIALFLCVLLLKQCIESWWDVIDRGNYCQHLIDRKPNASICFCETPPLYYLIFNTLFCTIICITPLTVFTYKYWSYIVLKLFLIIALAFGILFFIANSYKTRFFEKIYSKPLQNLTELFHSSHWLNVLLIIIILVTSIFIKIWSNSKIKEQFQKN